MTLTNLAQTTVALQNLLEANIPVIEPELAAGLTVSTLPPERAQEGANVLNLYCYHLTEDGFNKFRPRQSGGRAIATSPLTLVLYYIVTAHTLVDSQFDALGEQQLLGYALKTFHDYPVIDDLTQVAGTPIMPLDARGRNNRFEIAMMPMSAADALHFWANEENITVKPSAYVEVRPPELEPDLPTRIPGIVLDLGAFVLNLDVPNIGSTRSTVPYTLPTGLGGGGAQMQVSPAKVGPASALPAGQNVLSLLGTALGKGQSQILELASAYWERLLPEMPRVPVDMAANAAGGWAVALTATGAEVTLGDDLEVALPDGGTRTLPLYPGLYRAGWRARTRFDRAEGPRFVDERANDAPFTVNPRITGVSRDAGSGAVTLEFGGSWRLTRGEGAAADPVTEPLLEILLSVDGTGYRRRAAGDPAAPGSFAVTDHALTYLPLGDADMPGAYSVRVLVEGADAQPVWVEIP